MKPPQVGLLGASGRMGKHVSALLGGEYSSRIRPGAAISEGQGLESLLQADVVIDFSAPEAVVSLARLALGAKGQAPALVVGSTGWSAERRKVLEELSGKTPVLLSSNFSTGVHALRHILRHASPLLKKLGYTPVIVDVHHQHKKDAPSGTAISLQQEIAPGSPASVQTHAVRAGEVIGDHDVVFYGAADKITLAHSAQDRTIFARGAIDVALWLAELRGEGGERHPGLLGMDDFFQSRLGANHG